jgi:hypothetical protein
MMLFHESFRDLDVPVRDLLRIQRRSLIALARLLQVLAIQRAVYGDLALRSATDTADIAANARAETTRSP